MPKHTAIIAFIVCLAACSKEKKEDSFRDESNNYTVTTIAGSSDFGYVNGTGTAARFSFPSSMVMDASGNIYVSDRLNNRIRKIAGNVVTTYAGSGTSGGADGNSATAQFNQPAALAIDAAGNLYVVDSLDMRIRKITPAGMVSTFYTIGTRGFADGPLATARFSAIYDLVIDASGNIYVADGMNYRIRKISPAGEVTTFAGNGAQGYNDGSLSTSVFFMPYKMAMDQQGSLYVIDNHYIRKISGGAVSTVGKVGDENFSLVAPGGLQVDGQGTLYVGVSQAFGGSYMAKMSASGTLTKIAGGGSGLTDGSGLAGKINYITDMVTDQNGGIYFIDGERIRKVQRN